MTMTPLPSLHMGLGPLLLLPGEAPALPSSHSAVFPGAAWGRGHPPWDRDARIGMGRLLASSGSDCEALLCLPALCLLRAFSRA